MNLNDTCGIVGLQLGSDEQGHPPNVLLAARATTRCLIHQIAAPSAAAFLLPVPRLTGQQSKFCNTTKALLT